LSLDPHLQQRRLQLRSTSTDFTKKGEFLQEYLTSETGLLSSENHAVNAGSSQLLLLFMSFSNANFVHLTESEEEEWEEEDSRTADGVCDRRTLGSRDPY
jgi:hypothetical protein